MRNRLRHKPLIMIPRSELALSGEVGWNPPGHKPPLPYVLDERIDVTEGLCSIGSSVVTKKRVFWVVSVQFSTRTYH